MLVIHSVEACRRGLDATMWRLDKGNLHCDRCRRKKGLPQRRRSPVHLAALFGLLVIVVAWVAFAFAESGHQRVIDQALERVPLSAWPDCSSSTGSRARIFPLRCPDSSKGDGSPQGTITRRPKVRATGHVRELRSG